MSIKTILDFNETLFDQTQDELECVFAILSPMIEKPINSIEIDPETGGTRINFVTKGGLTGVLLWYPYKDVINSDDETLFDEDFKQFRATVTTQFKPNHVISLCSENGETTHFQLLLKFNYWMIGFNLSK